MSAAHPGRDVVEREEVQRAVGRGLGRQLVPLAAALIGVTGGWLTGSWGDAERMAVLRSTLLSERAEVEQADARLAQTRQELAGLRRQLSDAQTGGGDLDARQADLDKRQVDLDRRQVELDELEARLDGAETASDGQSAPSAQRVYFSEQELRYNLPFGVHYSQMSAGDWENYYACMNDPDSHSWTGMQVCDAIVMAYAD